MPFQKKPLAKLLNEAGNDSGLKRTLTSWNLIALGIGAIIGAGIFTLTGTVAALHSGPAIVISFILAAVACGFAGLCYSEFASMIPISGSAYTYGYATMGELVAWIIGWDLIIEYLFASSTVAVSWSGYIVSFLKDFGIKLPDAIAQSPFSYDTQTGAFTQTGALINFPAICIIAIISCILVIGISESAKFNNAIVLLKVTVILLFIGFGISHIDMNNLHPFIVPEAINAKGDSMYGWAGIFSGSAIIFFAYIGFDAVSTAAQEAKNPQRDMPIGMLGSLVACTLIYILVALVMTGVVPFKELNVPDPVAVAVNKMGSSMVWLRYPVKLGAIAGLSSVILVMLMGQPRIFYAMSKDGLLPPLFAKIHPKFKTPYVSTIITGVVAMLIAGIFPINLLGELVSIGTLLAFVIVCGGILVLRYKNPELNRPFKVPFFPVIPILGVGTCLFLMSSLPIHTWERLFIWMALGLVIYFVYGYKNSTLRKEREKNANLHDS